MDADHGWCGEAPVGGSVRTGGARTGGAQPLPGLPTLVGCAVTLTHPGGWPDRCTGVTDSQLAILLRQTQWALDDAAHDFPAGRASAQRREELAESLEALAALVRASASSAVRSVST